MVGQRYKKLFFALILGKDDPRSTLSNFGAWGITRTLRNPNLMHGNLAMTTGKCSQIWAITKINV